MEASEVYLLRVVDGQMVRAELFDDLSEQHITLWQRTWLPAMQEAIPRLVAAKVPQADWPQDLLWDWRKKTNWASSLLGMRSFCIVCAGNLEGMMMANLIKTCRLEEQRHKELVYVEFVSTAPWNRAKLLVKPRFHGIGKVFVRVAIELSMHEGFEGRIGLHSLPQANEFYRSRCQMSELAPDPKKEGLVYFEMTPEQATRFLEDN